MLSYTLVFWQKKLKNIFQKFLSMSFLKSWMQEHKVPVVHILRCESFHMIEHFKNEDKNAHTEMWLLPYEKVPDQGPVWVQIAFRIGYNTYMWKMHICIFHI